MAEKKKPEAAEEAAKTAAGGETELHVEGNVPVFIPKTARGDDSLYVCINGVRAVLQKGKQLMLSEPFAELIKNSMEMQAEADAYIEEAMKRPQLG